LHDSFKNIFRFYAKELRKIVPKIGSENDRVNMSEEDEIKIVYVINTCEYCLETIPGLHN
jgi:hypothetical protein